MATTWVKVIWKRLADVFINRQFVEPAGEINTPFKVEIGQNTFTVLTPEREIEAEETMDVPKATRRHPKVVLLKPGPRPPP